MADAEASEEYQQEQSKPPRLLLLVVEGITVLRKLLYPQLLLQLTNSILQLNTALNKDGHMSYFLHSRFNYGIVMESDIPHERTKQDIVDLCQVMRKNHDKIPCIT